MARIGVAAEPLQGRPTGIGRYTAGLLGALPGAAPEHEYVPLRPAREAVMRIDRRLRWQQWELPRAAVRAGVDVLHVTGFDAPIHSRVPVVLTVHDLVGVRRPHDHPPVARLYWGTWLPATVRQADALIANSDATRDDVARFCGIPPQAVQVVLPGIGPAFGLIAPTVVADVRHRHGLPDRYVLFVGTTEPRKGLDTLFAAFAELCTRLPHALVLVGPATRPLPAVPAGVPPERVRHLGYVADRDLPALYAGAQVVVLPSRHEGFGFPVVEAMACGTPVVCHGTGALPEVAAGAALHTATDDAPALAAAVAAVVGNPALAASLRDRGRARAQHFDWRRAAAETAAVYASVAERHRAGRR